jgi:hypothetical protein
MGSWNAITPNGLSAGYEMDMGDNSAAFMDKMGYKSVPTQVIEYTKSRIQRDASPAGTISADFGCKTQITEKIGYVPKDFKYNGRNQVGQGVYSNRFDFTESAVKWNLSYGKSSSGTRSGASFAKTWSAIFGGNHDYKDYGPCSPNMNLVNQLKNK